MDVELYLEKVNQEIIKKNFDEPSWGGNVLWGQCCVLDFRKPANFGEEVEKIADLIKIREEEFGGLAWVKATGQIYKLDKEAFTVLNNLQTSYSIEEVAKSTNVSVESINSMMNKFNMHIDKN